MSLGVDSYDENDMSHSIIGIHLLY